jgi:hypothetical protein
MPDAKDLMTSVGADAKRLLPLVIGDLSLRWSLRILH